MRRTYNNIARYNLIDTKYRQMAFRSQSDGAPISPYQQSFGTPGQTKVSGDPARKRQSMKFVIQYGNTGCGVFKQGVQN